LRFTANTIDPYILARGGQDLDQAKYEGLNQLSIWGAIVVPSTSTGFAMEFIGDAHDSATYTLTLDSSSELILGRGRGVN